ncbi:unnamed protein product [Ixodes pacificus]
MISTVLLVLLTYTKITDAKHHHHGSPAGYDYSPFGADGVNSVGQNGGGHGSVSGYEALPLSVHVTPIHVGVAHHDASVDSSPVGVRKGHGGPGVSGVALAVHSSPILVHAASPGVGVHGGPLFHGRYQPEVHAAKAAPVETVVPFWKSFGTLNPRSLSSPHPQNCQTAMTAEAVAPWPEKGPRVFSSILLSRILRQHLGAYISHSSGLTRNPLYLPGSAPRLNYMSASSVSRGRNGWCSVCRRSECWGRCNCRYRCGCCVGSRRSVRRRNRSSSRRERVWCGRRHRRTMYHSCWLMYRLR